MYIFLKIYWKIEEFVDNLFKIMELFFKDGVLDVDMYEVVL